MALKSIWTLGQFLSLSQLYHFTSPKLPVGRNVRITRFSYRSVNGPLPQKVFTCLIVQVLWWESSVGFESTLSSSDQFSKSVQQNHSSLIDCFHWQREEFQSWLFLASLPPKIFFLRTLWMAPLLFVWFVLSQLVVFWSEWIRKVSYGHFCPISSSLGFHAKAGKVTDCSVNHLQLD